MNFQELNSQSFSILFLEEFGDDDDKQAKTIAPYLANKKSDSRKNLAKPLMKKAASIRNVLMGKSSSEESTALLADSDNDLEESTTKAKPEIVRDNEETDKGQLLDDATKSNTEDKSQDDIDITSEQEFEVNWERNSPAANGVSRRRRNGRATLSRGGSSSRRLGDSLSSLKETGHSSRRLGESLSNINMGSSDRNLLTKSPANSQGRGRPDLVKQTSQRTPRTSRSGRRRNTSSLENPRPGRRQGTESGPKKDTLRNLEMALNPKLNMSLSHLGDESCSERPPMEGEPRLAPSRSSSDIEQIYSKAATSSMRRTQSSADCRRGGKRHQFINKTGDCVPAKKQTSSASLAVSSNGQNRGRGRTKSELPTPEDIDLRLEWRSRSPSRKNIFENCGEKDARTSNGKRVSLLS